MVELVEYITMFSIAMSTFVVLVLLIAAGVHKCEDKNEED